MSVGHYAKNDALIAEMLTDGKLLVCAGRVVLMRDDTWGGRGYRPLRCYEDRDGYRRARIWWKGRRPDLSEHRIILVATLGRPAPTLTVDHVNGCRDDNRADNLFPCDHAENVARGLERVYREPDISDAPGEVPF